MGSIKEFLQEKFDCDKSSSFSVFLYVQTSFVVTFALGHWFSA